MISLDNRVAIWCALNMPLEDGLQELLRSRIKHLSTCPHGDLLGLTHFLAIQAGDTDADIQEVLGFSLLENPIDKARYRQPAFHPYWDWLQRHDGWYEMIVTVGDSGFAYVLFIQDGDGVDADLLSLCRTYTTRSR